MNTYGGLSLRQDKTLIPQTSQHAGQSEIKQPFFSTNTLNSIHKPVSTLGTGSILTSWQNPTLKASPDASLTLLHINDTHRNIEHLTRMKTAFDEITTKINAVRGDVLKVHSGDYNIAYEKDKMRLQVALLNELGINFAAVGNHEFDLGLDTLTECLQDAKFISLLSNIKMPETNPLMQLKKSGKLMDSSIYRVNGHDYGVIGITTPKLFKSLNSNRINLEHLSPLSKDETIANVQEEIDKLKKAGVNKIILTSHVGYELDKEIAENTNGLDIILGGHSHDLLDPLEEGITLLKSQSNEPVMIFQEGRDGNFFGVADVRFDKKGILLDAIARQEDVQDFDINPEMAKLEEKYLGPAVPLAYSKKECSNINARMEENAIANMFTDAFREVTGADIGIMLGNRIRDTIPQGKITNHTVEAIMPYNDPVQVVKVTGKDIKEALTVGAKSYVDESKHHGILQVSGMKYTISPEGEAVNLQVRQKDGSYKPLDLSKTYTIASDNYLLKGCREGFDAIQQQENLVKQYKDTYEIINYYLSTRKQPISFDTEGRITVLAEKKETCGDKTPKALQKQPINNINNPFKPSYLPYTYLPSIQSYTVPQKQLWY